MVKSLDQLVDIGTSAVVVIDMQNDFCDPKGACAQFGADVAAIQDMIPRMQRFFERARDYRPGARQCQCLDFDGSRLRQHSARDAQRQKHCGGK